MQYNNFRHSEALAEESQQMHNFRWHHLGCSRLTGLRAFFLITLIAKRKLLRLQLAIRKCGMTGNHHNDTNLASYSLNNLTTRKRVAFTLAEVLITLAIIGVVAALTIPNIVTKYQKRKTVTQLKQTYTLLQNSFKMAENDYGDKNNWEFPNNNNEFFQTYLKPYLKVVKKYSHNEIENIAKRKTLNGTSYAEIFDHYQLANGSLVSIGVCKYCIPSCVTILIDINGTKEPNRGGIDIFRYSFTTDDGLAPTGKDLNRNDLKTKGSGACTKKQNGHYCPRLIMIDGWQISKDYPWEK